MGIARYVKSKMLHKQEATVGPLAKGILGDRNTIIACSIALIFIITSCNLAECGFSASEGSQKSSINSLSH